MKPMIALLLVVCRCGITGLPLALLCKVFQGLWLRRLSALLLCALLQQLQGSCQQLAPDRRTVSRPCRLQPWQLAQDLRMALDW